jgi:hypothetical protein
MTLTKQELLVQMIYETRYSRNGNSLRLQQNTETPYENSRAEYLFCGQGLMPAGKCW